MPGAGPVTQGWMSVLPSWVLHRLEGANDSRCLLDTAWSECLRRRKAETHVHSIGQNAFIFLSFGNYLPGARLTKSCLFVPESSPSLLFSEPCSGLLSHGPPSFLGSCLHSHPSGSSLIQAPERFWNPIMFLPCSHTLQGCPEKLLTPQLEVKSL